MKCRDGALLWAARLGLTAIMSAGLAGAAMAIGAPEPAQTGLSKPATEVMQKIVEFYDLTNVIIIAIAVFVLALMIYVVIRFNEKANPVPSKTTHHVGLEVAWTVIPIAILLVIAIPSFKLLYLQYNYPKPDLTIKAVGNAWYWEHEYLDHKGLSITSNMVTDEDLIKSEIGDKEFANRFGKLEDGSLTKIAALQQASKPLWEKLKQPRQLAVDNDIAVPVGKVVHLLVTSNDVIHSWTIPAFGSKMQAVPGRTHATWFRPTVIGSYWGQCSVLCGKNHSSMPIGVKVVSEQAFNDWVAALKAKDPKKAKSILKADLDKNSTNKLAQAQ
ncbi:MAG: cytochrome c oxidase subunit II [Hyphomicrobiaceae bacterium]|nr:cytochrome c oxidase subunit II [Hyphomicrobiaceae bacterium]